MRKACLVLEVSGGVGILTYTVSSNLTRPSGRWHQIRCWAKWLGRDEKAQKLSRPDLHGITESCLCSGPRSDFEWVTWMLPVPVTLHVKYDGLTAQSLEFCNSNHRNNWSLLKCLAFSNADNVNNLCIVGWSPVIPKSDPREWVIAFQTQ